MVGNVFPRTRRAPSGQLPGGATITAISEPVAQISPTLPAGTPPSVPVLETGPQLVPERWNESFYPVRPFTAPGGGIMYKTDYARNGHAGIVDRALWAEGVNWSAIGNIPLVFPPARHAPNHLPGGDDPIDLATTGQAGIMPAGNGDSLYYFGGDCQLHYLTGIVGPAGPMGPQGLQGPVGPTGPAGVQGNPGATGATGAQGPRGFIGPVGDTGPAGATGNQGPPGIEGPVGPQGIPGTGLVLKGTVPTAADLPLTGNSPGDMWIAKDTNDCWAWDGTQWNNVGPISGPAGPVGPAGPQGATGAQGIQGIQGNPGALGPAGPQGDPGVVGATGPQGATGPAGPNGIQGQGYTWRGVWSAATAYLPYDTVQRGGSSYVCITAGTGFDPATDTAHWNQIAQAGATGPTGPQGNPGPTGTTGAQGPAGIQGATGPQGTTGPQGPIGNTGAAGAQGPIGNTGAQGPTGPTGTAGAAGHNSFTLSGADFTVPPVGGTVDVTLVDASWVTVGQMIAVQTAGGTPTAAGSLQCTNKVGNTVTLLNAPGSMFTLADATQNGLLRQLSGNPLDYVDGTNNSHPLNGAVAAASQADFDAMINGIFRWAQRFNTTTANNQFPIPTGAQNVKTIDRWKLQKTGTLVGNVTRLSGLGQGDSSGLFPPQDYAYRFNITTGLASPAANDFCTIYQPVYFERGQKMFGDSSSLNVCVRAPITGTFTLFITNADNSYCLIHPCTIAAANSWQTFPVPGIAQIPDTSGSWDDPTTDLCYNVGLCLMAGAVYQVSGADIWRPGQYYAHTSQTNFCAAAGTFDILIFRHTKGKFIKNFVQRTDQEELRLCQRYFCKSYPADTAIGTVNGNSGGLGVAITNGPNGTMLPNLRFPVEMYRVPVATIYNHSTGGGNSCYVWIPAGGTGSAGLGALGISKVSIATMVITGSYTAPATGLPEFAADAEP